MNRWICPLLLLAGLVVLVGQATAQGPKVMRAVPPDQPVPAGDTFEVRITLDGAENLGSFQFAILYDPAILRAESARVESFLGSTGRAVNPLGPRLDEKKGRILFGAFTLGGQAGPDGSGTLATVVMRALRPGQSPLELENAQVTDIVGNSQPLTVQGAAVTVEPGRLPSFSDSPLPWVAAGVVLVLGAAAGFSLVRRGRGRGDSPSQD